MLLSLCLMVGMGSQATAQAYNQCAGMNSVDDIKKARHKIESMGMDGSIQVEKSAPTATYSELLQADESFEMDSYDIEEENQKLRGTHGQTVEVTKYEVDEDQFGNASGSEYDLAKDGAFKGQKIVILQNFDNYETKTTDAWEALATKGFEVKRYIDVPPTATELATELKDACQLWIISSDQVELNDEHFTVIKNFWDEGHGLYIWGDNRPYYADANYLMGKLFDIKMEGYIQGDVTVNLRKEGDKVGLTPGHLISTGIEYVYEGITIATVDQHKDLEPLILGSAGNLVTAVYEKDGKRLIIDGGFTRLFFKWDAAGSGRYVKNAAAWLVNYERFGDEVLGKN